MKTFIIQRKRTGMYYTNKPGMGLGGTLWTSRLENATIFTEEHKEYTLSVLAPNYGKCIAVSI